MLSIDVNDSGFRSQMLQLERRLGDMTPVMESIGMALESNISRRFETRTDPSGAPWDPWKPSTKASYPEDGNGRLLDRYGDMLSSLNHQADSNSVRLGFGMDYATYHEWGTEHMPRRGLLFDDPDAGTLGAEDEATVLDVLQEFLDGLGS
ncbi:phage virion morphogenesis protein [Comamonas odontotermitis]|uniref:phage virion morphogenesis protein n=1 Tax=Comamonas odontotermitis TaxID=379895 RepID=UPI00367181DD